MNFIGEECIVCHQKFTDNDDIVVCEICGTPYHRNCYKTFNKCINEDLHANGESFKRTQPIQTVKDLKPPKSIYEQNINNQDEPEDKTYNRMIDVSEDILKHVNLNPNEEVNGVSLLEFYLYTKSLRTTMKFYKVKDTEQSKKRIFNIFALLIPECFLASKSMYVETAIVYIINFLLSIPMLMMNYFQIYNTNIPTFINSTTFKVIGNVFLVLAIIFRVILSFKIIPKYFDKSVSNIKSIKKKYSNEVYLKKLLDIKSSSNFLAVFIYLIASEFVYLSFYFLLSIVLSIYFV